MAIARAPNPIRKKPPACPPGVVAIADPLKIELDDETFVRVMNKLVEESKAFFEKGDLKKRRKRNEQYFSLEDCVVLLDAFYCLQFQVVEQDRRAEGLLGLLPIARSQVGDAEVVIAGGMENMSHVPYALPKARWGYRMDIGGKAEALDMMVYDGLYEIF